MAKAYEAFEELVKFTLLTRERADHLVDRYSERKAEARQHAGAVNTLAALGQAPT